MLFHAYASLIDPWSFSSSSNRRPLRILVAITQDAAVLSDAEASVVDLLDGALPPEIGVQNVGVRGPLVLDPMPACARN